MKYHLARGEEQLGTFTDLDVSSGLRNGRFLPSDLCWTDGMAGWQTLGEHLKETQGDTSVPETLAVAALREEVRKDHAEAAEPASRGRRLAAWAFDVLSVLIPMILMLTLVAPEGGTVLDMLKSLQEDPQATMQAMQQRIDKIVTSGNLTLPLMSGLLDLAMLANIILLTVRGQTLGKLVLGIQIVRFADGSRAGFIRAVLLRSVLFAVMAVVTSFQFFAQVLLLTDMLFIFRQDRRCLHDLVADTKVVRRKRQG